MVIVARATEADASRFVEQYKYPFQLLLDLPMRFYRELGLRRSVKKVWGVQSVVDYAEYKIAGVPRYPPYPGDDIHVMGGDFMVDSSGMLVFVSPSVLPKDRPTVQQILDSLDSLKTDS